MTQTQEQYERNELRLAYEHLEKIEKASLIDRKEARQQWADALRTSPDIIAERVSWLLNGSYGYGEMQRAIMCAKDARNKPAVLGQLIAAYEWHCPASFAAQAWKDLPKAQQNKINKLILKEWTDYQTEEATQAKEA